MSSGENDNAALDELEQIQIAIALSLADGNDNDHNNDKQDIPLTDVELHLPNNALPPPPTPPPTPPPPVPLGFFVTDDEGPQFMCAETAGEIPQDIGTVVILAYSETDGVTLMSGQSADEPPQNVAEATTTMSTGKITESESTVDESQFECGCCFADAAVAESVPCNNGHLFCQDCIKRYVENISFEAGKSSLTCLDTTNCDATFSMRDLDFIDGNVIEKLQERQQKDELAEAFGGEGGADGGADQQEHFHQCPFCDFSCIVEPTTQIFFCFNCEKSSCQYCNVAWDKHFEYGYVCDEVENDDESKVRLKTEEAMTTALVRKCHKCATPMLKESGCNKMTCRCGAFFCYLCKQPIKGYDHFCQHAHDPGEKCKECDCCVLWDEPDDAKFVENERLKGEEEREKLGLKDRRKIGGEVE